MIFGLDETPASALRGFTSERTQTWGTSTTSPSPTQRSWPTVEPVWIEFENRNTPRSWVEKRGVASIKRYD